MYVQVLKKKLNNLKNNVKLHTTFLEFLERNYWQPNIALKFRIILSDS